MIIKDSKKIKGKTNLEKIKQIFYLIKNKMDYEIVQRREKLNDVYLKGKGDCVDYAELFIQMCRINKIPARRANGFVLNSDTIMHSWSEVYLKNYGWIPFDVNKGEENDTFFDDLPHKYIYRFLDYSNEIGEFSSITWKYWGNKVEIKTEYELFEQ